MQARRVSARGFIIRALVVFAVVVLVTKYVTFYQAEMASQPHIINSLIADLQDPDVHVRAAAQVANAILEALHRDETRELLDVALEALRNLETSFDYRTAATQAPRPGWAEVARRAVRQYAGVWDQRLMFLARAISFVIVYLPPLLLFNYVDRRWGLIEWVLRWLNRERYRQIIRHVVQGGLFAGCFLVSQVFYARLMVEPVEMPQPMEETMLLVKIEMAGQKRAVEAVPMLLGVLENLDAVPELRWRAAYSLGRIANRQSLPSLLRALRDSDAKVRQYAAWAVGNTCAAEALRQSEAEPLLLRFCTYCGAKIRPDDQRCWECGQNIRRTFGLEEPKDEKEEKGAGQ